MKRTLLIIFAIFYLGTSQGATLYFHYCMDELVQLGMTRTNQTACDFCGMTKKEAEKKSCCKDDSKQANVDNYQQAAAKVHFNFEQAPILIPNNPIWQIRNAGIPFELDKSSLSNAPPQRQLLPVFIRNCTYRI